MTTRHRLGFLGIAVVIAVVAVILLTGRGDPGGGGGTAAAPSESPWPPAGGAKERNAPDAEPTRTPRPRPPLLQPGEEAELEVVEGDRVRLRVRSDTADHVHVHGYDIFRDVPAGQTVTVSFRADITGVFDIELEESHQPLGRLKVVPE